MQDLCVDWKIKDSTILAIGPILKTDEFLVVKTDMSGFLVPASKFDKLSTPEGNEVHLHLANNQYVQFASTKSAPRGGFIVTNQDDTPFLAVLVQKQIFLFNVVERRDASIKMKKRHSFDKETILSSNKPKMLYARFPEKIKEQSYIPDRFKADSEDMP